MKRAPAGLSLLASAALAQPAIATNSTNGPPPEAKKEGGIAGDPSGAIRAVGGTSQNGFKQQGGRASAMTFHRTVTLR